ncbi:MAG TPA: hypothetical protein VIL20_19170 [Sandaracinaceae bacterium]
MSGSVDTTRYAPPGTNVEASDLNVPMIAVTHSSMMISVAPARPCGLD